MLQWENGKENASENKKWNRKQMLFIWLLLTENKSSTWVWAAAWWPSLCLGFWLKVEMAMSNPRSVVPLGSPPVWAPQGQVRTLLVTPSSFRLSWGSDEIIHVKHPESKCLEKVLELLKCVVLLPWAWHPPGRPVFLALVWDLQSQFCFESHLIDATSSGCRQTCRLVPTFHFTPVLDGQIPRLSSLRSLLLN